MEKHSGIASVSVLNIMQTGKSCTISVHKTQFQKTRNDLIPSMKLRSNRFRFLAVYFGFSIYVKEAMRNLL
jgi:hypothetical protein